MVIIKLVHRAKDAMMLVKLVLPLVLIPQTVIVMLDMNRMAVFAKKNAHSLNIIMELNVLLVTEIV